MADDEAKGVVELVELAMSMPDATAAIRSFVNNSPELPQNFGSDEHNAFLAGKDATVAVTLAAFRADHRSGPLKALTAEEMLAIGSILLAVDDALSEKAGVTVDGRPLREAMN